MAEDEQRLLNVNKLRDINANGISSSPLTELTHSNITKREAVEHLGTESESGRIQRWQGRNSLPEPVMDMGEKSRQSRLSHSFSLADSRDLMQNTAISSQSHFLPGIGNPINSQQMYFYRGDPRLSLGSAGSQVVEHSMKSQICESSSLEARTNEDQHHNSVSSSNISFQGRSDDVPSSLQHDSVLSEESVADTSAASPPASVECVVCGDKSSGKHYGQYTCEGCKSFFKRSVRRNLSYTCRGSRNCNVDIQHRNQCQYCRFQKCIKLGMRREAVQKGRVPQNNMLVYQQHLSYPISWSSQDSAHPPIHGVAILPNYTVAPIISTLVKADDLFPSRFSVSRPDNMVDQSSHLLIGIIEWAKRLPNFCDFSLHNQVALLKNCWPELFLVSASQVAMPVPIAQMVSACLSPETDRVAVMSQLVDHSRVLQNQLEKLKNLSLDMAEFASLKAIMLFNPDTVGLDAYSQVESIQEKVHCALEEYMRMNYPSHVSRFGKVLLRLPTLCKASSQIIEQLILMRLVNRDSVETLIQNFLLRSTHIPINTVPPLSHSISSFGNIPTHSVNGMPPNAGGATVLTPQLPSPCLPASTPLPNAPLIHPSNPVTPVSSHLLHTATPTIANHWLNNSASLDTSSMGIPISGNSEASSIISHQHHLNI